MKTWTLFEKVPAPKDFACPNCGNKEYFEGPSGGISTNVECSKCGLRWNANTMGFDWEYIGTAEGK